MDVTLKLGDCLDVMREMDDQSVDAVITDPPYGLGIDYGEFYIDTAKNLQLLVEQFLPEARRVSRRVIVSSAILTAYLYPQPNWIVACTWNTTGSYGKYGVNQWFPLLCYGKDIDGFGSINGLIKGDWLAVNGGASVGFMRDDAEKIHPCPKPLNLVKKMVNRFTNKDDTVLDPFMGSGTTGVACVNLNRNFIGCEINPEYFAIAEKRINNALALQGKADLIIAPNVKMSPLPNFGI